MWNKVTVKRSDLRRVGTTFGKNLSTVRAIRVLMNAHEGGAKSEVRLEDARIDGGVTRPIFGEVEWCYIYVRNDGTYLAKSAPSAASSKATFFANGATVRIPADASRDTQVNEIWLFRRGGGLPDWYRTVVNTAGLPGVGQIDINDTTSNKTALTTDVTLESDNVVPPDGIIGIAGPYYDRTFYLTQTYLYPSRRRNPDSCSTGQAIQVAGADEVALWVRKTLSGLLVGTTKDIYRLAGDGAEYPDGTINFTLQPLNIDNPPQSSACAKEGNLLVYQAADGWRAISGGGSELLTGDTSLLYRGETRHGVQAVNTTGGRLRAAIAQGMLTAITPEGIDTTSSTKLYRHFFDKLWWYRHTYSPSWRSIYREPDGTLIAGDNAGFVWILDSGDNDDGSRISVTMWTKHDDLGVAFNRKDPYDFRVLIDTGGRDAQVKFFLDKGIVVAANALANTTDMAEFVMSLMTMSSFRLAQVQVTGDFNAFRWATLKIGYNQLPMVQRGQTPAFNFGKPGLKTMSGIQLRVCTLNLTRTFTPVLDGIEYATFAVRSRFDEPVDYTHPFPFPITAQEIQLRVDGDVELYDWNPLVTAVRPLGILTWDSGPMDLGIRGEIFWPREVRIKVQASADLVVQPYFDGFDYGTLTATIGPNERGLPVEIRLPLPRGYKGSIPRFIITSTGRFYPYWTKFIGRTTSDRIEKPEIVIPASMGGEAAG